MTKANPNRTTSSQRKRRLSGPLFTHPEAHKFFGEIDPNLDAKMDALPFVKKGAPGKCSYWNVKPSGDYAEECELGSKYARLVLPFLKFNLGPALLGWIIKDMIARGECSGIEIGFAHTLGEHLGFARGSLFIATACTEPHAPAFMKKMFADARPKLRKQVADAL
jgi:hypothetical protein